MYISSIGQQLVCSFIRAAIFIVPQTRSCRLCRGHVVPSPLCSSKTVNNCLFRALDRSPEQCTINRILLTCTSYTVLLRIRHNGPRTTILPRPLIVSSTWTSNVYMTTLDYYETPVAVALRCGGSIFTLKGYLLRWGFIYWNLSKLLVCRAFVRTPRHNFINHKWSTRRTTGGTTGLTTVPMC